MTDSPLHIGMALFPGFQALDVFGPLDCLNTLSRTHNLTLSLISSTLEPVTTRPSIYPNAIGQSIMPTHTYSAAPRLDVLIVPGGFGTRGSSPIVEEVVSFIREVYPSLKYLITICTGAGLAARAGVLDGKRATTNKMAFNEMKSLGTDVMWVSHARWVVDGSIWTSAGVSAGIDVTLAWVGDVFGEDKAKKIAGYMEYDWHRDASWDPFAELCGL
ncbi:hypothetical protein N7495_006904 [Penicillium taxi]|uniref:uncharacterized protein n=1 Tax=Penicillium taxi TaxID=168475 RepID=UPI002545A071|nr:uncharacterized protein N7495_006904 [Penicillium taxi]KAJ5895213.1 hypothetical protein N7495_006904 [Penicillium taxi]